MSHETGGPAEAAKTAEATAAAPAPAAAAGPAAAEPKRGSFRLAAYAVCVEDGRVLLAHHTSGNWTLPGGGVEHAEDPFDAVIREVVEETGYEAVVERLLGVDSRVIPAASARAGVVRQNVGVFYQVRVIGGRLRPESNGDTDESAWTPIADVSRLRRSSLVDVGLALVQNLPATGHVAPVTVGGLIQH